MIEIPTTCPVCGEAEFYNIRSRFRRRCKTCKHEWSAKLPNIYRQGKKTIEEFERLLFLYKKMQPCSVRKWFLAAGIEGHTAYSLVHRWKIAGLI